MTPVTDRRKFIGAVALAAISSKVAAQQSRTGWRVGFLISGVGAAAGGNLPRLRKALAELGYVEGINVAYFERMAGGRIERLPVLATELIGIGVDVIVTVGSEATQAAKRATGSVPIVFLGPSYPIEEGLVASLARPGGNVTGITLAQSDLTSKQLQVLRDLLPTLADVAVIWSPANPGNTFTFRDMESAAGPLQIKVNSIPIKTPEDVDPALAKIRRLRPGALVVLPSQLVNPQVQRIGELAVSLGVPSISALKELAERGLLLSYGADIRDLEPRIAAYVDRIFKGAQPADLPVERPTRFQLTVNMKTAKALRLTVPQALLLRADERIE